MNKPLYFFPHLPKTGGAALCQNMENFLTGPRCLRLNCTYRQYYFNPRTQALCFYEDLDSFNRLLHSLSEAEKSQIEFMSGHDLPYGLHHHFSQPVKYFLFIREPIARTISLYNYQRTQHDFLKKMKKMDESHRRLDLFSKQWFLIDGKVPSFEEWLEKSYNGDYPFYFTMTRQLQQLKYLDEEIKENSWNQFFQKFFFIGLTESLDEDELYVYHEMGTRRFWANRNVSDSYVSYQKLDLQTQKRLHEKNQDDFMLYERAKEFNASFKRKKKNFSRIIRWMRGKKKSYFLIEKGIPLIKFLLRPLIRPIREWYKT